MASVPVLARLVARPLDALAEHLPRAIEGHTHDIHQARVASRRLRELLPIVGRAIDRGPRRRLRRRLRALTRTLGPVRELDVTLESIAALTSGLAAPPPFAATLTRALEHARTEKLAALAHRFDPARVERLLARLRRLEKVLQSGAEPDAWRERLADRVRRRASALARAVADAGALFVSERLHAVRIAGKQLRYALEVTGDARLAGTATSLRTLKDTQNVLGKLHDADVLLSAVTRAGAGEPEAGGSPGSVAGEASTGAAWFDREITTEMRRLHARYLRRQARLVALADHALDTLAPRIEAARPMRASSAPPQATGVPPRADA
jgi:CHAD domain-containing protein